MNNENQPEIDNDIKDQQESDFESEQTLRETLKTLLTHSNNNCFTLLNESQKLIEAYGFSKFKNTFDTLLFEKSIKKCSETKTVEKYILDALASTMSYVVFKGARFQAHRILGLLEETKEEAKRYVEEKNVTEEESHNLQCWKISFRQEQKKQAQQELVKQIEQLQPQGYNNSVYTLERAKQARINLIEKMTIPAEYYASKIIVAKFLQSTSPYPSNHTQINLRVAAQQNKVFDFILNDILSHETRAQCLKNFERYIQVAEQLLQNKHVDAATVIISALNYSAVERLELAKKLTRDIQKKLTKMTMLINPDKNHKAHRDYILKNSEEYLSPSLIQKSLLFGLEVAQNQNMNVLESPFMIEAELNCRKIRAMEQHMHQFSHVNLMLKREMRHETVDTQAHYENSLRLKPKNAQTEPIYQSQQHSLFASNKNKGWLFSSFRKEPSSNSHGNKKGPMP